MNERCKANGKPTLLASRDVRYRITRDGMGWLDGDLVVIIETYSRTNGWAEQARVTLPSGKPVEVIIEADPELWSEQTTPAVLEDTPTGPALRFPRYPRVPLRP